MSYIYLASPYSHPNPVIREHRYSLAVSAFAWLSVRGDIVYSPIVHCHVAAQRYKMPTDHVFWARLNFAMLRPASTILILHIDGWLTSSGLKGEISEARRLSKPIGFVRSEDQDNWSLHMTDYESLEKRLGCLTSTPEV